MIPSFGALQILVQFLVGDRHPCKYSTCVCIPIEHLPITVGGTSYDLTHLQAFSASIPGKGNDVGTDLLVDVVFSNHVYTERTKHGEQHHAFAHHGTKRTFDSDRYEMSKTLGVVIKSKIENNELTYVSKSYGGVDNLVFVEMEDGHTWAVVYCLQPLAGGCSVRMEILSSHRKVIYPKAVSRRNLSYFSRSESQVHLWPAKNPVIAQRSDLQLLPLCWLGLASSSFRIECWILPNAVRGNSLVKINSRGTLKRATWDCTWAASASASIRAPARLIT